MTMIQQSNPEGELDPIIYGKTTIWYKVVLLHPQNDLKNKTKNSKLPKDILGTNLHARRGLG